MPNKLQSFYFSSFLAFLLSANPINFIQAQSAIAVTDLSADISETSGLIQLNGRLYTHNDSDGLAELYEIDTLSGEVSRTIQILNAQNTDWEDICFDATHVYIGDIGNNSGNRTDLKIYKISRSELENEANTQLDATEIAYSYADQESFEPSPFATNFDAEALVASGDSLYIFTKNWIDNLCNVYSISKTVGTYISAQREQFNSEGLITGADLNHASGKLVLSGYQSFVNPFVIQIDDFLSAPISELPFVKSNVELTGGYSVQVEAIAFHNAQTVYMTAEENFAGQSGLHRLFLEQTNSVHSSSQEGIKIFPNPAANTVHIQHPDFAKAELYDLNGKLCLKSKQNNFSVEKLASGKYVAVIKNRSGVEIWRGHVVVN